VRWQSGRRSGNVLDRRGISLGRGAVGGGALIAALIATLLGAPQSVVRSLLEGGGGEVTETESGRVPTAAEEEAADFVKVVLGSTEDVWTDVLPQQTRRPYEPPKLVLFTEAVQSACGIAGAAVGPFYCPLDSRIYLDLSFFGELAHRFGAPGDFAQAYVVAHEIGHHVQNLLGIADKVRDQRSRLPPAQSNQISVANELQADCVAGVWAYHANKSSPLIEPGDAEEGLAAASAIGDDRLQQQARGRVMPESFTHGSSAQRVRWFKAGLASGRMADCDTFTRPGGGL
jgi:predicted metalloprotease